MFRGCWHIVLAIGLATLPLESRAQVDEQETRGKADQQQHPPELTPLPIIVIEDEAAAEARRNREESAEHREIDDLIAQQGMNEATQRVANLAKYQTWLIFAGTIALVATLYFTRRAVLDAREMGQRQMRAYVGVGATTVKMGDEGIIGASMRVDNTGQTPAKNMTSRVSLSVRQHPSQDPLPVPEEPPVTKSRAILHGGKSATVSKGFNFPLRLDRASQQMIADGRGAIFMHGEITYEDVFDDPHTTEFCLIHTGAWGGEHKLDVYETGNKAD